jgi:beta-1,4-N-acetylglucosaminyltransferase
VNRLADELSQARPGDRTDLLLVCQSGGHLLELIALHDVWSASTRLWVTLPTVDAKRLLKEEEVVWGHGPTPRNIANLFKNAALALQVVRAHRPRVVLTTGAGLAVPFAWVGRLFGASVVYVECGGRVSGLSLSCRLIAPVAERIYVQWPDQDGLVAKARYVGNIDVLGETLKFLPPAAPHPCPEVLVTTGAGEIPFERLVLAAGDLECKDSVLIQCGASNSRPGGVHCIDYLPFDELIGFMRGARVVVTHGGVGSITLALACGKHPIVMPRRGTSGEHVDDHQVAYANRLADLGLVSVVETPEALRAAVSEDHGATLPSERSGLDLVRELRDYVRISKARRPAPAASR